MKESNECIAKAGAPTEAPPMIDLHCHILPEVDDGPQSLAETLRMARFYVADGVDCSYICDIAIHPDHQGRGLGKEMMARLVAASQGHRKIILYAVPGKEGFYRNFGFRRMRTAMAIFADELSALASGYVD